MWAQFIHPAFAQRHLPDIQIFSTDEYVQLDTIVEHPAINHGRSAAAVPLRGENLSLQIFIPRAGGLLGFECTVSFANPDSALTNAFEILSVKDWHQRPLKPIFSTQVVSFYNNRLEFSFVPPSGHIATAIITPRRQIKSPLPLKLTCSVTIVSTPPRRVWQMRGAQTLYWQ